MQFTTLLPVFLAITSSLALPSPAGQITDLDSCLAHADTLPNPAAAAGWAKGCHVEYNGAPAQNISTRAFEEDFGAPMEKRCKNTHKSCCCFKFCFVSLSCPVCASGCTTSCTVQYGGDCVETGDCGSPCT